MMLHNGVAYDVEMDYDPDWLIIKAEGTWEYWDYDDTRQREFQGQGNLEIGENGIIMGNGLAVFTASGIVGNNMIVRYNEYDDDGTEYHEVSYIKVQ